VTLNDANSCHLSLQALHVPLLATLAHAVGLAGPCWALRLAERLRSTQGRRGRP